MQKSKSLSRILAATVMVVITGCYFAPRRPVLPFPGEIVIHAQALPAIVKIGVDPDPSVAGYRIQVDGGAAVDQGLPATNPSCVDFFSGTASPCVPFTLPPFQTAGRHTVNVTLYTLGGSSSPVAYTFNLDVPGPAKNPRAVK
jgi:hypothetical protein